jgi:hypothetical protein
MLEDVNSFDEPTEWQMAADLSRVSGARDEDEGGFRSLVDDPDASWVDA